MESKKKTTIRDAVKMVLEEKGGCPLDCEVIRTIINNNLERYGVKKIETPDSIPREVNRKPFTDLKKMGKLIYIAQDPDVVEMNLDNWKRSDIKISITKKLIDKIGRGVNCDTFCRGIQNITDLLGDWYNDNYVSKILHESSMNVDNQNNNSKRELKVILGTREEVIKLRKEFKGIDFNPCDFNSLKLEIISHISSKNTCENITELDELYKKFKNECIKYQDSGRYAYYRPIKCEKQIEVYPVFVLGQENNSNFKCIIHDKAEYWNSDFIVMPYDIEENSRVIFRPKFYQALYHELYHFLVINTYRGSKKINEGIPELYSEICYKNFLYIRWKLDIKKIEEFCKEYMRFRDEGPYKPYYDYMKNKMDCNLELAEHKGTLTYDILTYDMFCDFVLCLIRNCRYDILECGDETPEYRVKFKKAIEEMCTNYKDLKLNDYEKLEKYYKEGYKFLIVTGIDMRFENQMWIFSDLYSYVKEPYKKGKRVSIIVLKKHQVVTSEYPLKVNEEPIENFLHKNKDVDVFRVKFKREL